MPHLRDIPEDVRSLLAPGGRLRVGINLANPVLVTGRTAAGTPEGLAPALAGVIADHLGAELVLAPYRDPAALVDAADADEWDMAFLATDPAREPTISFSSPYAQLEARYLVHGASGFTRISDVDREGVRIVALVRSAYALWLEANLKAAQLISVTDGDAAARAFDGDADAVLAGLGPTLHDLGARVPGSRMLDGHFMAVRQAIGVPRSRGADVVPLSAALADYRESGLLASLIARFDLNESLALPEDVD
jgi:polar amino acid transport system substrate-binding protein